MNALKRKLLEIESASDDEKKNLLRDLEKAQDDVKSWRLVHQQMERENLELKVKHLSKAI